MLKGVYIYAICKAKWKNVTYRKPLIWPYYSKAKSKVFYIEFSQRMPLNPAYYSKPELMVFECGSLPVTPYDLAYIYTPNWWFWSPWAPFFCKIRRNDGSCIQNVALTLYLNWFLDERWCLYSFHEISRKLHENQIRYRVRATFWRLQFRRKSHPRNLINTMRFHAFLLRFRESSFKILLKRQVS